MTQQDAALLEEAFASKNRKIAELQAEIQKLKDKYASPSSEQYQENQWSKWIRPYPGLRQAWWRALKEHILKGG